MASYYLTWAIELYQEQSIQLYQLTLTLEYAQLKSILATRLYKQEFGDITTKEAVLHVAYTSVVQEPEASGGLKTLE